MAEHNFTAFERHDHSNCSGAALAAADARAKAAGLRMTPVRRRALEILLEEHRALGAYDVLERLAADGFGAQPPVAYRALDFLVQHGFAHRIEGLNAFMACLHAGEDHEPVFFICEACKVVAEAPHAKVQSAISDVASDLGFTPAHMHIEILGLCPSCAG